MMKGKNISKLSEHKIKKGRIITPFNDALGNTLKMNSWSQDRLPEYLWLALILSYYGREQGLCKAGAILYDISRIESSLTRPKISSIFGLSNNVQRRIYEAIISHVEPYTLSPLTVLYRHKEYPDFNEFFYNPQLTVEERISVLEKTIKDYFFHQSFEATDVRYLALCLQLFNGKIHIMKGLDITAQALKEYPYTPHEDKKMRFYRPTIRSLEGVDFEEKNQTFIDNFWRELGMISSCKPMYIKFDEDEHKPTEYLSETRDVLNYLILANKEKALSDPKFEVIIGSTIYTYKIFNEVIENNLNNKILGRHAIRTMIEVYLILKYLLKKETENPGIWREYQYYGISKYKLILLKARENQSIFPHHLAIPVLDMIVNEKIWEEFIDIDLRYFDQQGIREKSIDVGEKELYDLFYDYDSNFAHGLWGSVRESSMLICDNPAHQYHNVPDIELKQNLPSVQTGCVTMMKKIMMLVSDLYRLPDWYISKYVDLSDESIE